MQKSSKAEMTDDNWKYKVEDGTRTLMMAEEIKQDPKLYKACLAEMEKKQMAMSRVMNEGKSLRDMVGNKKEG